MLNGAAMNCKLSASLAVATKPKLKLSLLKTVGQADNQRHLLLGLQVEDGTD
jgi:hypothetical protein